MIVAGASGYAGALAAELVSLHPSLELAGATARSDVGSRLNELYPAVHLGGDARGARPGGARGRRRRDRRLPARRLGARSSPRCAAWGSRSSTSRPTSGCATCRRTSAGTGPTGSRTCWTGAVYGLTELNRERIAEAELVANPGCYPTATLLALAPLAAAGLIDDVVIDAKSGVSGAGGARPRRWRRSRRATTPGLQGRRSPSRARDRPGVELAGRSRRSGQWGAAMTFVAAPDSLRPGRAGQRYVTTARARSTRMSCASSTRIATAASGSSSWWTFRPASREVRDTNLCRIHVVAAEGGRVIVVRRDRQPLEGRGLAGDPEPEPDAGAARRRGNLVTATTDLLLARGGSRPRMASRSSTRRGWLPASAPLASPAASRAGARPTSACSSATPTGSARRWRSRPTPRRRPPCGSAARNATRARSAPSPSTPATPTPPPASRATATRSRCATPRPRRSASRRRAVAIAETGTIGVPLERRRGRRGRARGGRGAIGARRRGVHALDHDHRPRPQVLHGPGRAA